MPLRITLDPSFDTQKYNEAGVGAAFDIFAEVSSVIAAKGRKKFVLKECPLELAAYDEFPTRSMVVICAVTGQSLHCWWNSENCRGYVDLPVQVRKFTNFPGLDLT